MPGPNWLVAIKQRSKYINFEYIYRRGKLADVGKFCRSYGPTKPLLVGVCLSKYLVAFLFVVGRSLSSEGYIVCILTPYPSDYM